MQTTAQWDIFEFSLTAQAAGNPYLDTSFEGVFSIGNRKVRVPGFYDGDGVFRLRFCPDAVGEWSVVTRSNLPALDGQTATVTVTAPRPGVHGPVHVRNSYHFAYADGTPYFPFTTTCYAWTHQPLPMQDETLQTLADCGAFNKLRMCVFPKNYPYNTNAPLHDVYHLRDDGKYDPDLPNYVAFQHLDAQVARLAAMGIEADIIIFHPYDRWDHCMWTEDQDIRYLRYLVARLAAYRNVWWSLANEYDFMLDVKPMERWDRFFKLIEEDDHLGHPESIHQGDPRLTYDHRQRWVSHVSIQHSDVSRTPNWRAEYNKPVLNDEMHYEGNIIQLWGNITAETMTHRFWMTVMKGGYGGHGETYVHPQDLLWWAKGGKLYGQSQHRIAFLRRLLEEDVVNGLTPYEELPDHSAYRLVAAARDGDVRYIYLGEHRPVVYSNGLPKDDGDYEVDIIDTWEMTVTPAKVIPPPIAVMTRHGNKTRGGKPDAAFGVELPGKPGICIRIRPR